MLSVVRYHDFSAGHRVVGHEGKCSGLHGHNYRVHFHCTAPGLDAIGRVIDFSVIKSALCNWLEETWDHKMLLWDNDPIGDLLMRLPTLPYTTQLEVDSATDAIYFIPFNPTAENMAHYLLYSMAPSRLRESGITCNRVVVEETRKCSAIAEL